jgi:two-component system chemotaxis response regulator CheV
MDKFQQEIDERANLTSSNKFELLLFRAGAAEEGAEAELFGINVFKIREIVPMQNITTAVGTQPPMMGMVNLRGQIIPVVDLSHVMNCKPATGLNILLVTEYSRSTQAFAVESVDEIVRLEWSQVMSAEANTGGKFITSIARLNVGENAGKLVQVLDVEQIIYDISPTARLVVDKEDDNTKIKLKEGTVVIAADDSRVARNLIEQGLTQMGLPFLMHKTGKEAWERLQELNLAMQKEGKTIYDKVALVLTDLEMPEMDGFTLTRNIKTDERFKSLPVVVHSSLSGAENEAHTKSVGADGYVGKFSASELSDAIRRVLEKK